jgi:hypothetical protein
VERGKERADPSQNWVVQLCPSGNPKAGFHVVKSAILILNDCVKPKQVSPELAKANLVQLDDMPACVGAAAVLFVVGTTPVGP